MTLISFVFASLLVLYMIVAQPWMGARSFTRLTKEMAVDKHARSRFYLRGIVLKWALVLLVGLILGSSGIPLTAIGLHLPTNMFWTVLGIVYTLILVIIFIVFSRRLLRSPEAIEQLRDQMFASFQIIPTTPMERFLWVFAAITAGVCEEILFRGFFLFYLGQLFPMLSITVLVILSSLFFGIAHLYQGWRGIVATGIVGAVLALAYTLTGSLLLPIVAHSLIDLRVVFLNLPAEEKQ